MYLKPAGLQARSIARDNADRSQPGDFHARVLRGYYKVTPLVERPTLAKELGIGRLLVKDESSRLGLPAVSADKILSSCYSPHIWAVVQNTRRFLCRLLERVPTLRARSADSYPFGISRALSESCADSVSSRCDRWQSRPSDS